MSEETSKGNGTSPSAPVKPAADSVVPPKAAEPAAAKSAAQTNEAAKPAAAAAKPAAPAAAAKPPAPAPVAWESLLATTLKARYGSGVEALALPEVRERRPCAEREACGPGK